MEFYSVHQLTLLLFAAIVSACAIDSLPESLMPEKEIEFAKEYLSRIKNRDFVYVKSILDKSIEQDATDDLLDQVANYFYAGEPISIETIGSYVNITNGVWTGNFTFDYEFVDGWLVANAALKRQDGGYRVIGFSAFRTPASQRELNAFQLADKSALHYTILVAEIAVAALMVITFVVCIRTRMVRRKWLWSIITLLGWGTFQFNWANGEFGYQLLSIQLVGMGATKAGPAAPWLFAFTIPVGAIAFWFRRPALIAEFQANKRVESDA